MEAKEVLLYRLQYLFVPQALLRGTFRQENALLLISLAVERYVSTVHQGRDTAVHSTKVS